MAVLVERQASGRHHADVETVVVRWSWVDLVGLLALAAAAQAVAWAVHLAGWHDARLPLVALPAIGVLLGAVLARWRALPALVAYWLALAVGGGVALRIVGPLIAPRASGWQEEVEALVLRLYQWIDLIQRGQRADDSLLAGAGLAVGLVLIGFMTTWNHARYQRFWLTALPVGALVVLVLGLHPRPNPWPLALYSLGATVLLAHTHAVRRLTAWRMGGLTPPHRLPGLLTSAGLVCAVVLVGGSWLLPELGRDRRLLATWERAIEPWRHWESLWNRAFGHLSSGLGLTGSYATFGPGFEIGGFPALTDTPVARVADDEPRYLKAATYDHYTGRGWQTTTPESFPAAEGGAIFSSQVQLGVGSRLPVEPAGAATITAEIEMLRPRGSLLLVPGQFVAAPRVVNVRVGWVHYERTVIEVAATDPATMPSVLRPLVALLRQADTLPDASIRLTADGAPRQEIEAPGSAAGRGQLGRINAEIQRLRQQRGVSAVFSASGGRAQRLVLTGYAPRYEDVEGVYADQAVVAGSTYRVQTIVAEPLAADLRAVTAPAPDWVRARYLALPEASLSVLALADTIAGQEMTAYDKAKALERALRTLPYDERVGPPPPGRDVVEHFLFDLKRGYCEYYASAFVVMARALGLPARVVTGYGPGEPVAGGRLVRELNAHAWAEVYFAGYGWVTFEPTPAVSAATRGEAPPAVPPIDLAPPAVEAGPPSETTAPAAPDSAPLASPTGGPAWLAPVGRVMQIGLLLVALAAVLIGGVWWEGVRGLQGAGRWFGRVQWLGRWAGAPPRPADTPYEYARTVGQRVPAAAESTHALAQLYVQERYAGRPLTATQEARARRAWSQTRLALLRHLVRWRRGEPPG